jgi:DNA-directed RNA polymerase subunit RPC12/RpoP
MSTALDDDTMLMEFLSEEVECEAVTDSDPHAADVYAKIECPKCSNGNLWAACLPHFNLIKFLFKTEGKLYRCKNCKEYMKLEDNMTIVGPVR